MKTVKTFRFDDISINTNEEKLISMIDMIFSKYTDSEIILGISPFVHDMSNFEGRKKERIFPEILNVYSDFRVFYNIDKVGIPINLIDKIISNYKNIYTAGHGLVHVDHRLINRSVQEISILLSCNLIKSSMFIPPFNKYNKDTEEICNENNIKLLKFEDGWTHLFYYKVSDNSNKYYVHSHDFDLDQFKERL